MFQRGRNREPPPTGIVFNTSMTRPDAALALAAIYSFTSRREAQVGSVCVSGAGLDAAIFCDIVRRFYITAERNSNQLLPVGLTATEPMPPNPPMVRAALERTNDDQTPYYRREVNRIADTALGEAILRNGVIFNAESTLILSAPATSLARSLDILGTREIYSERVRRLVIVDTPETGQDADALERIVAEWPSPIVFCGSDVGDALPFPGAGLDEAFSWSPIHPVVDAYRAFQAMPYDVAGHDLAAVHFGIHPDSGLFQISGEGSLSVAADGALSFGERQGNVRRLSVDPESAESVLDTIVAGATAAPTPPASRTGRGGAP